MYTNFQTIVPSPETLRRAGRPDLAEAVEAHHSGCDESWRRYVAALPDPGELATALARYFAGTATDIEALFGLHGATAAGAPRRRRSSVRACATMGSVSVDVAFDWRGLVASVHRYCSWHVPSGASGHDWRHAGKFVLPGHGPEAGPDGSWKGPTPPPGLYEAAMEIGRLLAQRTAALAIAEERWLATYADTPGGWYEPGFMRAEPKDGDEQVGTCWGVPQDTTPARRRRAIYTHFGRLMAAVPHVPAGCYPANDVAPVCWPTWLARAA